MKKDKSIDELARLVAARSICKVKVGAVIYDKFGIIAWGWNHSGPTGYGLCAERHAIKRANKSRLKGSTLYILSIRRGKSICSLPCMSCLSWAYKGHIKFISAQDSTGHRKLYRIGG